MPVIVTGRDRARLSRIPNGPWAANLDHPMAEGFQLGVFVLNGYTVQIGAGAVVSKIFPSNTAVSPAPDGTWSLRKTSSSNVAGGEDEVYAPVQGWGGNTMTYHARFWLGPGTPTQGRYVTSWWDDFDILGRLGVDTGLEAMMSWVSGTSLKNLSGSGRALTSGAMNTVTGTVNPTTKRVFANGIQSGSTTSFSGPRNAGPAPSTQQMLRLGLQNNEVSTYFGPVNIAYTEQWGSSRELSAAEVLAAAEEPYWWLYRLDARVYFLPIVVGAAPVALSVNNITHAHSTTQPTLTGHTPLAVNGATHAHSTTQPTLTGHTPLTVNGATHAHAVTQPTLTGHTPLSVNSATHAHTVTQPTVSTAVALPVDSIAHAHAITEPALVGHTPLAVNSIAHAHSIGQPALVALSPLSVDNIAHAHTIAVVSVGLSGVIAPGLLVTVYADDLTVAVEADDLTVTVMADDYIVLVSADDL